MKRRWHSRSLPVPVCNVTPHPLHTRLFIYNLLFITYWGEEAHSKWINKETPEEFLEDQEVIWEEAEMNIYLIQQMLCQGAR